MEAEKKETLQVKKEIRIGIQMTQVEDLGTDNPDLMITIKNNGPAREIEYFITDQQSRPDWTSKLYSGDEVTIRLGDYKKGTFLALTNRDFQEANVLLKW